MSLNLTLAAGEDSVTFTLGGAESKEISALGERFPKQLETLFGAEDFGKPVEVESDAVLAAAESLRAAIKDGATGFGVIYQLTRQDPVSGAWFTTSHGMQVPINGIYHLIEVGCDQCTMRARRQDDSGKVVDAGAMIDLRSQTSIETDRGRVFIEGKTKSVAITKILRPIITFAEKHSGQKLMKIIG